MCVHHWRIEEDGPGKEELDGECLKCDETRTFPKWVEQRRHMEPAERKAYLAEPLGYLVLGRNPKVQR